MPEFDVEAYKQRLESSTSCEECKVPLPKLGENERYVFISYSHKDYKQVYADLAELYAADIPFWYDEGLYSKAGVNWDDVVREKMTNPNCAGIIFYMSKNLFTSRSIQTEIRIALGEDGNPDLPQIKKIFFAVNLAGEVLPSDILKPVNFWDMFTNEEDAMSAAGEWMNTLKNAFPDRPTYLPITAPNHKERLITNIDTMFGIKPNYNPYAFGDAFFRSGNGIIEFSNGAVYEGSFADGLFEGQGKITWTDGDVYTGDWKGGRRHGQGAYTWPDGGTYIGEWVEDRPNGQGKRIYPDGGTYTGEWAEDRPNGQGERIYPDGGTYVGEWANGLFHGQGTMTEPDGRKYVGEWQAGVCHGQGTYIWPDGGTYVGEWVEDKQHGQGTYIWPGGAVYEGQWKNNHRHGQGKMTYPDGETYVGEWSNGKWHGIGTLTLPDGTVQSGRFENGEYIGPTE